MSRFYGHIEGTRKLTVARGRKSIKSDVRTWDVGVQVVGRVDVENKDFFMIYATGGNSRAYPSKLIAIVRLGENGPVVELA